MTGGQRRVPLTTRPPGVFTPRTPRAGSELLDILLEHPERTAVRVNDLDDIFVQAADDLDPPNNIRGLVSAFEGNRLADRECHLIIRIRELAASRQQTAWQLTNTPLQ